MLNFLQFEYLCINFVAMEYTAKDLKPITDWFEQEGHGSKIKMARSIKITPQQLSFYLRFMEIPPKSFKQMISYVEQKTKRK